MTYTHLEEKSTTMQAFCVVAAKKELGKRT
jgi:hypothetical protein